MQSEWEPAGDESLAETASEGAGVGRREVQRFKVWEEVQEEHELGAVRLERIAQVEFGGHAGDEGDRVSGKHGGGCGFDIRVVPIELESADKGGEIFVAWGQERLEEDRKCRGILAGAWHGGLAQTWRSVQHGLRDVM